jgi:uncharacterized protein (DUF2252 family)
VTKYESLNERRRQGALAVERVPLGEHARYEPQPGRPDAVGLLESQNETRDQDLVPVRHGRMMASAFTFYRGAAKIMATDLAGTPNAGLTVQLCGDAHLSNFGLFASPERTLVFDLNDFDETLPGPFEYDVKRMAASFTIAARNNGYAKSDRRAITRAAARAYREALAEFASMSLLDVWYSHLTEQELMGAVEAASKAASSKNLSKADAEKAAKTARKTAKKAHSRDSLQAMSKLAEQVDGRYRIVSQPPVVVPSREIGPVYGLAPDELLDVFHVQFRDYRKTLQYDRRQLLEHYEFVDMARKVVGVGSVGTRAFIVLLQGRDEQDPLFLQVKEATASVLEDHLPKSVFAEPGERVVQGQRMMQASSDIFLGWTKGVQEGRHLYWRQLRDMKGSALVETMIPYGMEFYAGICGWTLARAHARSGDAAAISAYLGETDEFDKAIVAFSDLYAEQNERDYAAFAEAIKSGRLEATEGT